MIQLEKQKIRMFPIEVGFDFMAKKNNEKRQLLYVVAHDKIKEIIETEGLK